MYLRAVVILINVIIIKADTIKINEVVSKNNGSIVDEDGNAADWVELYNASSVTYNLEGYQLSDDPSQLNKWIFPNINIEPDSFLLIFASNKNRKEIISQWHSIIDWGDDWYFWAQGIPPDSNWTQLNSSISNWLIGPSGFGYGDNDDNTYTGPLNSIFVKKMFNIEDPENISKLLFHMDYDDGYIAYINGEEFSRRNMGPENSDVVFNQYSTGLHEAEIYAGGFPEPILIDLSEHQLIQGENIIAVQVHNYNSNSSDLTCIPFLTAAHISPRQIIRFPNSMMDLPLTHLHTNFKINSSGEKIILSNDQSEVIDSVYILPLTEGVSFGRINQGAEWALFNSPTPGSYNSSEPFEGILSKPIFSIPSGFYGDGETINLLISSVLQDAEIRFTIDQKTPNPDSELYQEAIQINSNTVIRSGIFADGWIPSPVETKTYIFRNQHQLPSIFLNTDSLNLFDQDSGIYVKGQTFEPSFPYFGANFWKDWEKPIHFEILEQDGTGYGANAGIKIFGGWSRAFPQKSVVIYSRKRFGPGSFNYKIFPDSDIENYEAFVLRNSGNDWESTMFRDGFISSLAKNLNIDFQKYRPAATYINSEFWGIQNIRNKINEHYLSSKYSIPVQNIDLLELEGIYDRNIINGTNMDYINLINYIESHEINDLLVQNAIANWIDIQSFLTYQAFQIYIDNRDWPGNNIKFWRDNRVGGKWRWILYDTDFGFGIWDPNAYTFNTLGFALESNGPDWPNPPWSTFLFRKLMENDQFKFSFINIYCDLMNTVFEYNYISSQLDSITTNIENVIPAHKEKWYNDGNWPNSANNWELKIDDIKTFSQYRQPYAKIHIQNQFNLYPIANLNLNIQPPDAGSIQLNSILIDSTDWSGNYFQRIPQKIKAIPNNGFVFTRWLEYPDSGSVLSLVLTQNTSSLTAIFNESNLQDELVVINEINYNSSDEMNPDDWIEIFNPNNSELNLSGWTFKDEDNEHMFIFPSGTLIGAEEYLVVAKNENIFSSLFPSVNNVIGSFEFGLSGGGDQIRIFNNNGDLVDSLEYDDKDPWPNESDGEGPSLELINPELDNSIPSSWKESLGYGTPGQINSKYETLSNHKTFSTLPNYNLGTAYPNPFNPEITIPIFVKSAGHGHHLSIYNLAGKEVAYFDIGHLDQGKHEYKWRPSKNTKIASGIFFIQLNTPDGINTRKIIYLK